MKENVAIFFIIWIGSILLNEIFKTTFLKAGIIITSILLIFRLLYPTLKELIKRHNKR